jgi:predicted nuclease of predicted toxin-antitoxin system
MKFIVDAQLPYILAKHLTSKGFDCIHTDDLPLKERTPDKKIREISEKESRIVITKDIDFLDSYYLQGVPQKLLLITTGNIRNKDLILLMENNWDDIMNSLEEYNLVELNNNSIIGHE